MTLKDFLEKHGEVEITEEKEKQIKDFLGVKENENSKRWKPKVDEEYYYIDNWGDIDTDCWNNCKNDIFSYLTNNCFKTKEEAKFHLEKLKVYYELKNFADENNEEMDWKNHGERKYYIYFSHASNTLEFDYNYYRQRQGNIYFSSKELAEQAIEKVGEDRIKKYLFGVE